MRTSSILFITILVLSSIGCSAMYVKPASATHQINANSVEKAVKAAVTASGKTETRWTPKTISIETGYFLAEFQPDVIGRSARSYAYTLEVRVPEGGRGDVQVTVTPPQGISGGKPTEDMVKEFFDAYEKALKP
jgi:hypothetical protein